MTLLHEAAGSDDVTKVEALLRMGANASITANIRLKSSSGSSMLVITNATPIYMAIYNHRVENLACLLLSDDAKAAMAIKSMENIYEMPLTLAMRIAKDRMDDNSWSVGVYL